MRHWAATISGTYTDTSIASVDLLCRTQCVTSTRLVGNADFGDGDTFGNSATKSTGPGKPAGSSSYCRRTMSRTFANSAKTLKRSSGNTTNSRVTSSDGSGRAIETQQSKKRRGIWPRWRTRSIACSNSTGLVRTRPYECRISRMGRIVKSSKGLGDGPRCRYQRDSMR